MQSSRCWMPTHESERKPAPEGAGLFQLKFGVLSDVVELKK